jgi:hypothetical protein
MHIVAGPPVDLSAYRGKELTTDVLRGATDEIMKAVAALLEGLRGETAPTAFFDARALLAAKAARAKERTSA